MESSKNIINFALLEPPKPLNNAQMRGSFYFNTYMVPTLPFHKSYACPLELVKLLKSRGLIIQDTNEAEDCLSTIGYYRLSAYMYPFLTHPKSNHIYKTASTFDMVMRLYQFDKALRLFIFNEVEKIEVAVRTSIVNIGCEMTGDPFWMTNKQYFSNKIKYTKTLDLIKSEIKHSREDFITHFYETYSNKFPPAWILSEILPFGVMTTVYSNIRDKKIKKKISKRFGLQIAPFESWLTIMTLTRNICCHHSRIWNKQFTLLPMIPNRIKYPWINLPTDRLRVYFNLCIIKYFINIISPDNKMTLKLQNLLKVFPEIDPAAMGFPKDWEQESLWRITE